MHYFLIGFALISSVFSCSPESVFDLQSKVSVTKYEISGNPYDNQNQQYKDKVQANLHNKEQVCALKYTDTDKTKY